MSEQVLLTEEDETTPTRRLAAVWAQHHARPGTPPGVDPTAFAYACLADTYEVAADLAVVDSGLVAERSLVEDLLWPRATLLSPAAHVRAVAAQCADRYDELVLIAADVPDLPGLVIAKVFKALQRADVCVSLDTGGTAAIAIGVRLPLPAWLTAALGEDTNLDLPQLDRLRSAAPRRALLAMGPRWHRLNLPGAVHHLDPRLEGWDMTRLLLSAPSDHRPGRP